MTRFASVGTQHSPKQLSVVSQELGETALSPTLADQASGQPPTAIKTNFSYWGGKWLEWLVITLAVTLFCAGFLDLRASTRLPGNEAEIFQMLDWTLVNSLKQHQAFPLWNIHIQSGLPYVADPMLHAYNPVVTLPVLLVGVRAGFKLGVYFSFLLAALGMWHLARTMGLGRAARLWMALMFAFAGQPVARFLQGQYLFVLGFAYIPWVVSSLVLVMRHRRKRDIALAAGSMALLFFSGNVYYPLYMLLVIVLLGVVMLFSIKRQPPFVSINLRRSLIFAVTGALAVGVIAIQLLPTAEFWPRLSKDVNLAGSHTPAQIFLDYTSSDTQRTDAYSVLPAREEFYAYIGLMPFLSLALLPLAAWRGERRMLVFFVLVALLTVGWISLEWMPWREAFLQTRLFLQFRHLLRILVFGSFAIICLAGMGLDALWKSFEEQLGSPAGRSKINQWLGYAGLALLGAFMLYGVGDIFSTNQFALRSQEIHTPAYEVMGWVRENDPGDYYVRHNPTNAWQDAVLANDLRYLDSWYHFADIRSLDGKVNERLVQAGPKYLTQSPNEPNPESGNLMAVVGEYNIFSLPESLPMTFLAKSTSLQPGENAGPLLRSEVTPLAPLFPSPNRVEMIAEAAPDQLLVVMMTHYPGWQVNVDGEKLELLNVGGYMAVAAQPGVHKYTFRYSPAPFFTGLVISLASTLVVMWLFFSEVHFDRQAVRERWQVWASKVSQVRLRLPRGQKTQQLEPVEAVYRGGSLVPSQALALEENARVRVTVEAMPAPGITRAAWQRWIWASSDLVDALRRAIPLEMALFAIALVFYLATRLVGLENFPIYFFTDEAVQTVMAEDFIQDGLRNYDGEVLPTYFSKGSSYNLSSVSVYLQVIPYLLFGKSVFVTRAVSVLITSLGALAVGLILRDIFKLRYWWSGVLLLSVAPAWLLHSRTAFETAEMASFYAGFLYFYLRYRCISPRALYPALVMGALVFYTYSPGQLIIVVSGLLLLFLDLRYHWQNRQTALKGLLLLGVLALPYLRYLLAHSEALGQHLSTRAPYWAQNIPFVEKLGRYFSEYAYAFSPGYWFIPNQHDLERHLMNGYGHLLLVTLPLIALGLVMLLVKLKSPPQRIILAALLAAPSGAALVGIGITRVLVFIIPAVIIMALGLDQLLGWIEKGLGWLFRHRWTPVRRVNFYPILSVVLLIIFLVGGAAMLGDALANGPTWYQDYTLAGMQYGASQLYGAVEEYMRQNPGAEMIVSPSWTNGADAVAEFFLPQGLPVKLGSIEGHLYQKLPLEDNLTFVMIPVEMEKAVDSGKFKDIQVEQTLLYPNGEPGFYFARLQYADNIDAILASEQEQRSVLNQTTLTMQGESVQAAYSMLDMGSIELIFDGDMNTVARTLEANPFVIELTFAQVRQLNGYRMILGSTDAQVTVLLDPGEGGEPLKSVADFDGSVSNPVLEVSFGGSVAAKAVRFEILQPYSGVPANVHVWEIELK